MIDLNNGTKNVFYKNAGNTKVVFNNNGTRLAVVGSSYIIEVFSTDNLSVPLYRFSGHNGQVWDLQFSNDGKQLASGSWDATVRLWDLMNPGSPPVVLQDEKYKFYVNCLSYSSDDKYLYVGMAAKLNNLKKWPTNADLFDSTICTMVTRNLTQDEWETYVATDIKYQKTCPSITK